MKSETKQIRKFQQDMVAILLDLHLEKTEDSEPGELTVWYMETEWGQIFPHTRTRSAGLLGRPQEVKGFVVEYYKDLPMTYDTPPDVDIHELGFFQSVNDALMEIAAFLYRDLLLVRELDRIADEMDNQLFNSEYGN